MIREPYSEVKVTDLSQATVLPAPSNLEIVSFLSSPTGTTELTTITSRSDLVERFLTNNKVLSTDHTTIKHLSRLLSIAPIRVLRVCNCSILSGIDTNGTLLYFDKNYRLIPTVTKVDITTSDSYETVYIKDSGSTPRIYYVGTSPSGVTGTKIEISSTANVETLIKNLNVSSTGVSASDVKGNAKNIILGRNYLSKESFDISNIENANKITYKNAFKRLKITANSALVSGDFITIGARDYVYETTDTDFTYNNTKITIRGNAQFTKLNSFIAYIYDEIIRLNEVKFSGTTFTASANGIVSSSILNTTVADHVISRSTNVSPIIEAKTTVSSGDIKISLVAYNSLDRIKDGYIHISDDDDIDGVSTKHVVIHNMNKTDATIRTDLGIHATAPLKVINIYDGTNYPNGVTGYLFVELARQAMKASDNFNPNNANPNPTSDLVLGTSSGGYITGGSDTTYDILFKKNEGVPVHVSITNVVSSPSTYEIVMDSESSPSTLYEYEFPTHDELRASKTYTNKNFKIGNNVFYTGDYTALAGETVHRLSSSGVTTGKFLELLYSAIPQYIESGVTEDGFLLKESHSSITTDNGNLTIDSQVINQTPRTAFAIVQGFVSAKPIFKFSYRKQELDNEILDLTLTRKGVSETHEISFNSSKVNGSNVNIHYSNLNRRIDNFQIVELNEGTDFTDEYESRYFGNDVIGTTPRIEEFINASQKLLEIDDFYPDVIFDGGLMNANFYKALIPIARELHAKLPMSTNENTKEGIIAFREATAVDDWRGHFVAPAHWDSGAGDFSTIIGQHLYYIEKMIRNANSVVNEFSPIFGRSKGVVTTGGLPVLELGKTDREELLKYQINWATYSETFGVWYYNNNLTMQKKNSELSEDQHATSTLLINQIVHNYMKSLTADYNTLSLREGIISSLSDIILRRIFAGHGADRPVDFLIICDDTNNTPDIIEQRRIQIDVRVQYQRSVAYKTAINKIYSLSSNIYE